MCSLKIHHRTFILYHIIFNSFYFLWLPIMFVYFLISLTTLEIASIFEKSKCFIPFETHMVNSIINTLIVNSFIVIWNVCFIIGYVVSFINNSDEIELLYYLNMVRLRSTKKFFIGKYWTERHFLVWSSQATFPDVSLNMVANCN